MSEVLPDFAPAKPFSRSNSATTRRAALRLRKLVGDPDTPDQRRPSSAIIRRCVIHLWNSAQSMALHRFLNNEGTVEFVSQQESTATIEIRASAQAPDGMIVQRSGYVLLARYRGHEFPKSSC